MSDFFTNLALRARGVEPAIRPNLSSFFDAPPEAPMHPLETPDPKVETPPPVYRPQSRKSSTPLSFPAPIKAVGEIQTESAAHSGETGPALAAPPSAAVEKSFTAAITHEGIAALANETAPLSRPVSAPSKPESPEVISTPAPGRQITSEITRGTEQTSADSLRPRPSDKEDRQHLETPIIPSAIAPEQTRPSLEFERPIARASLAQNEARQPAPRFRNGEVQARSPSEKTTPHVQITIGRLEIRASATGGAPQNVPAGHASGPRLSLEEYLRRANGGAR